ncbi:MAG: EamA family transporter [Chloroflexi bacterium]|nr:EamA family transporter [Chloroflexota bacterium]
MPIRIPLMSLWIPPALGAALLASFNPVIVKRLLRDTDVTVVAWAGQAFALPLLGLTLIAFFGPLPRVDGWFYLGVAGSALLNAAAHLTVTRAYKEAAASLVSPLLAVSPAVTLLVSAFTLREIPSPLPIAGVGSVILGAYLLNLKSVRDYVEPLRELLHNRSLLLALFAGLLWGLTPIFEKTAIRHTFPENSTMAAFSAALTLGLLLLPVMLWQGRQPFSQIRAQARGFLLLGLIGGLAPLMGYAAFRVGPVGYVSALFKLSAVFTLAWAYWLLRERDLPRRLPGALIILTGAALIGA